MVSLPSLDFDRKSAHRQNGSRYVDANGRRGRRWMFDTSENLWLGSGDDGFRSQDDRQAQPAVDLHESDHCPNEVADRQRVLADEV
jgi:hypothetical protein